MATLPQFQTDDKDVGLLQNRWGAILNPIIGNPITNPSILSGIAITVGKNVINHKLQQKLQGWFIAGKDGPANIYDIQASNQTPNLTLTLVSDVACNITLVVF